jgi:hypothetical protein
MSIIFLAFKQQIKVIYFNEDELSHAITLTSTASISAVNQKPSNVLGMSNIFSMSYESYLLPLLLGIGEDAHPV